MEKNPLRDGLSLSFSGIVLCWVVGKEGLVCEAGMVETWCDSAAWMDGRSLCDFFELNLKGDLGDLGDFGLKADLGLLMKSCSSLAMVVGSVSGCGVDFRAIVNQRAPPVACSWAFRLQAAAAGRRIVGNVSSAQPGHWIVSQFRR